MTGAVDPRLPVAEASIHVRAVVRSRRVVETLEYNLSNPYAKLDLKSRTQLVARLNQGDSRIRLSDEEGPSYRVGPIF